MVGLVCLFQFPFRDGLAGREDITEVVGAVREGPVLINSAVA
jgi:hypothetical protein